MKVRVVNFRLTLTPALSHKWERERFAVRRRFFCRIRVSVPFNLSSLLPTHDSTATRRRPNSRATSMSRKISKTRKTPKTAAFSILAPAI